MCRVRALRSGLGIWCSGIEIVCRRVPAHIKSTPVTNPDAGEGIPADGSDRPGSPCEAAASEERPSSLTPRVAQLRRNRRPTNRCGASGSRTSRVIGARTRCSTASRTRPREVRLSRGSRATPVRDANDRMPARVKALHPQSRCRNRLDSLRILEVSSGSSARPRRRSLLLRHTPLADRGGFGLPGLQVAACRRAEQLLHLHIKEVRRCARGLPAIWRRRELGRRPQARPVRVGRVREREAGPDNVDRRGSRGWVGPEAAFTRVTASHTPPGARAAPSATEPVCVVVDRDGREGTS